MFFFQFFTCPKYCLFTWIGFPFPEFLVRTMIRSCSFEGGQYVCMDSLRWGARRAQRSSGSCGSWSVLAISAVLSWEMLRYRARCSVMFSNMFFHRCRHSTFLVTVQKAKHRSQCRHHSCAVEERWEKMKIKTNTVTSCHKSQAWSFSLLFGLWKISSNRGWTSQTVRGLWGSWNPRGSNGVSFRAYWEELQTQTRTKEHPFRRLF